jgi:hypothetical protein
MVLISYLLSCPDRNQDVWEFMCGAPRQLPTALLAVTLGLSGCARGSSLRGADGDDLAGVERDLVPELETVAKFGIVGNGADPVAVFDELPSFDPHAFALIIGGGRILIGEAEDEFNKVPWLQVLDGLFIRQRQGLRAPGFL